MVSYNMQKENSHFLNKLITLQQKNERNIKMPH